MYAGAGASLALGVGESSFWYAAEQQQNLHTIEAPAYVDVASLGNIAISPSVDTVAIPNSESSINMGAIALTPAIRLKPPIASEMPTTTIEASAPEMPEHYETWLKVSQCESNGNWSINTGNGFYGGLQFTRQSWVGAGGLEYAARADLATPLQQIIVANRLQKIQGWRAWPGCARKLGLR